MAGKRIPVILDTDIGGDIDDTWALAMLLKSPELEIKLVTTASIDVVYRAKVTARMLEVAGRTDVPVGIGIPTVNPEFRPLQQPWVADYDLDCYPGKVYRDGVGAMVETIMNSPERITLIAVGPLTNVAAALKREPRIAERADFVGMHGSIFWRQKDGSPKREYNVKANVPAFRAVLAAPWTKTITPLDTCALVKLTGAKYQAVCDSPAPLARAVIENYEIWRRSRGDFTKPEASSILFDCVAVYLAFSDELLNMRRMGLNVDDAGFVREDPAGHQVNVALTWKDLPAFEDLLVERLT